MSRIISTNFVLVGANAGKTGEWGNKKFVDGLHPFYGTDAQFAITCRFLADYAAHPIDTDAHAHAVACYDALLAGQPVPDMPVPPPPVGEDPGSEPNPEMFENTRLITAILALDPDDGRMWTKDELPLIGWVERMAEFGGVNRRMVNEAIPGWNRSRAKERAEQLAARSAAEAARSAEDKESEEKTDVA